VSHPLRRLARTALTNLAEALREGRLVLPLSKSAMASYVPLEKQEEVCAALNALHQDGMAAKHIALTLTLLAEERAASQQMSDRVQLVWSPPELDHVNARDTAVVVQGLFREAKISVIIVSYALDQGQNAESLFGELAARMDASPSLRVRLFTNIQRKYGNETPSVELAKTFAKNFRENLWPGARLPEVYYDPRSLELEGGTRSVLHAKCIVVDGERAFLTSANFTVAAQLRNIEAGVLVDDKGFATRLVRQFEVLVESNVLQPLP
jgi:phosphatidylserine/phosphatidylglycerophosphate/cardiolipin synthase-like enzyme